MIEEEREDVERFFIRYYMDDDNLFVRYFELVEIYGILDRLVEVNLKFKEIVMIFFIYDD